MKRLLERILICPVLLGVALTANAAQVGNGPDELSWIDLVRSDTITGAQAPKAAEAPRAIVREHDDRIEIDFTLGGFLRETVETEGNLYTSLNVPGTGLSGTPGGPALPFKGLFVEIPDGVDVVAVASDIDTVDVVVSNPVLPLQPSVPDSEDDPPFVIDDEVYCLASFLPERVVEVAEVGFVRGTRVASLRIHPIQYNPATGELKIHTRMRVSLSYQGEIDPRGATRKQRLQSEEFHSLSDRLIENYRAADTLVRSGRSSAANSDTLQSAAGPADRRSLAADPAGGTAPRTHDVTSGADYLIIVADDLLDDCTLLDTFAEWKTMKGYVVAIENMSDVGTTAEDIAAFIQDAYDTWDPAPTYVLLVGNAIDVPSVVHASPGFFSDHDYALT